MLAIPLNSIIPRIVAIGTSAGGLDALERFLRSVPNDTGLAFVIIHHLSVDHKSHLAELLGRQTDMPIITVITATDIEPNVIYIRTPQEELEVDGVRLLPVDRVMEGPDAFYPIDRFFTSLAEARLEQAIGIILSGMGSDGSRGVATIKERGGLVLVQEPDSAQFSSMPFAAMGKDVPDLVAPPERLGMQLQDIIQREQVIRSAVIGSSKAISFQELCQQLIKLIGKDNKMDFREYRPSTIQRRIEKRILITRTSTYEDYLLLVKNDAAERHLLAKSFLIGVTRFFRDTEAFAMIRDTVIPEIFKNAEPNRPVRIWVPSCSTGEEAYSIAMLMDAHRREHQLAVDFKVLASDIDPVAVQFANQGLYHSNIVADIPSGLLDTYFDATVDGYQVVPRLRDQILFAVQDLLHDPPFIHVDLITCRNFLIYVNTEAQSRILANFHFALNHNGYLMLGPSENLGKLQNAFRTVDRRWKLYLRHDAHQLPLPLLRMSLESRPLLPVTAFQYNTTTASPVTATAPQPRPMLTSPHPQDQYAQYLADRFAPACLFVDRQYNLVYINGDVEDLLHFPRQHASFNLRRVIDEDAATVLTSAVNAIFEQSDTETFEEIHLAEVQVGERVCSVRIQPAVLPGQENALVAILLEPISSTTETTLDVQTPGSTSPERLMQGRIQTLEDQLLQSNLKTQRLLSELEATNEELQTSNRELLASNEEMQSTNEELQSVNEELHTVNHEIQKKNEQLKVLNNDINHLLESIEIGTIFLDEHLRIRRFTPTVRKQFSLHSVDIGRPITDFSSPFGDLDLVEKCEQVLDSFHRFEQEVRDKTGRSFLLRILPYRDLNEGDAGLTVTFIDINDLVEARTKLQSMAVKYEALLNNSPDSIAIIDASGRIQELNRWIDDSQTEESLRTTFFTELIDSTDSSLRFTNTLRDVVKSRSPQRIELQLSDKPAEENTFLEIVFVSASNKADDQRSGDEMVMLIISDISKRAVRRQQLEAITQEYRERLMQQDVKGGIMDLSGNIIHYQGSSFPDHDVEEFIQHCVTDFLTPPGQRKFWGAVSRVIDGSFRERVHYLPEDLTITAPDERGVLIDYRPIIVKGEVQLLSIRSIEHDE